MIQYLIVNPQTRVSESGAAFVEDSKCLVTLDLKSVLPRVLALIRAGSYSQFALL